MTTSAPRFRPSLTPSATKVGAAGSGSEADKPVRKQPGPAVEAGKPTRRKRVPASEAVAQLRAALNRANELAAALEGGLSEACTAVRRVAELEPKLAAAEEDASELSTRLVEAERHAEQLMNLYVASYQLHGTLVPEEVEATIIEIAITLLGAERLALLLRGDEEGSYDVAIEEGLADDPSGLYADGRYRGGDRMVDETLADGVLRLAEPESDGAAAAVPLSIQGSCVGALVLLKLLSHRPALGRSDRELLDLLGAHAASALLAARSYAVAERKLHTLEELVKLARGV